MSIRLCLMLCFVHLVFCDNVLIDETLLQNVFGKPSARQPSRFLVQAAPVTAHTFDSSDKNTDTPPEEPQFIQSSLNYDHFDWVLTKKVAASSEQNFLLSPLGLKLALAILTEAATGTTRRELSNVLVNDLNITLVRNKYTHILDSLYTHSSEYILNLGNRIYLEDGVQPQQRFAAIAQSCYKTELVNVNFNDPMFAANQINAWVANITAGKISALVDEDDVYGVVALVLTTFYYKGNWVHQFPLNGTKAGNFFISGNQSEPALFMKTKDKFYFAESAAYDAKILRLPYLGNKFSMYIIVPNSLTGLSRVMSRISVKNIRKEIEAAEERLVDLTMPRFRFDYTSLLDNVLQELGIRQAFQETASFPGIARGKGLRKNIKISRVLQRSGIEVNEIGSVAYSATEITLVNKFSSDEDIPEEVVANRPFLFFIQDDATRQLLFTGRVTNPALVDGAYKF